MELYHLRSFVTVAREGNLTRAAERLFASQPTVSAHIKTLEDEFGLKLFERTALGMQPTPAGEALWPEAERVLSATKDLTSRAAALKGQIGGALRLGLNNDVGVLRTTELLSTMGEAHPALRFKLSYGTSGALLQGVLSRDLDAGFFDGTLHDGTVELIPLTHLTLVIAVPVVWAAELDRPDWRLLEQKPWVTVSPLCSHYEFLQRLTADQGVTLHSRFSNDDDATALNLVAAEMAVCLTSEELLRTIPGLNGRVAIWPHFRHKMPLSLCLLKSRVGDPMIRELIRAARATWASSDLSG